MARENLWRAPRIHKELVRLGFDVSQRTVARYVPKVPPSPAARQSWRSFLKNHRQLLLHHVIVLNEDHLRRLLRDHVAYHNADRCHCSLSGNTPGGRAIEPSPQSNGDT